MILKKALALVALFALVFGASPAVAADENENDRLAHVALITAKPGHEQDLEKAITAYHRYMADKEGAWRYNWYSIVTGPDSGKYIARSGNHNWVDFDAVHDWQGVASEKFNEEVAPHIQNVVFSIHQTDKELGIWPESMEGYEYFSVTEWRIKHDQGPSFKEGLKKINKTLNEHGFPVYYMFSYPVSGGKGNSITLVSPRKNFADMAPKEPSFIDIMNKAMGEEEARAFLAEWSQTYKPGQNQLLKFRKALSDYGDD
jgi:hypothetical protein